jgi:putative ABC transport system permease protein
VALDGEPTWDLYLTYPQIHLDNVGAAAANMFWIVRTTGDPMTLGNSLASEVRRVDPEVVAAQIKPLDRYLSDAVAPRRFSLSLMAAFALTALALAITGIYAVVMYSVSQRAREIGIPRRPWRQPREHRPAGDGPRHPVHPHRPDGGIAMAAGATHLIAAMFFGVAATDVATMAQVVVFVAAVSVIACAVPTARAERLIVSVLKAE